MRILQTLVFSLLFLSCISFGGAAERKPEIVPFTDGQYMIYGGGLADAYAPKTGDAKLYLDLSGNVARQMFDRLGRNSERKQCVEPGEIYRRKGDVVCTRSRDNKYFCKVGFDLTTGKSIVSSIC